MIAAGCEVEHAEFGIGQVFAVFGSIATVDFFGEKLDVDISELLVRAEVRGSGGGPVPPKPSYDLSFRRSFEAVNLGVVPADPDQLVKLTIGGNEASDTIRCVLRDSPESGACRVFMGYYGSGKSHHLRLVKAIALREGWVTASLELDPKAADPSKPSSLYRALLTSLEFPLRTDGTRSEDFFDFVKEIRDNWTKVRSLKYFSCSPWFSRGLDALQYLSHRRDDPQYVSAVSWLAGQVTQISAIRSVTWRAGFRQSIPTMPQSKDTGLLYAFHLVVINEVLKALGYRGLAVIIDEVEHVRTYSANRYLRANNLFDVLARCAHRPRNDLRDPWCDYDMSEVPPFWREGPHFGLFVGLTEGDDTRDLKRKAGEMSVLIHSQDDVAELKPPSAKDYEVWAASFLAESAARLGPKVSILSDAQLRDRIAVTLREYFEQSPDSEKFLRNWTKMAAFPAAVLMSHPGRIGAEDLVGIVSEAARQVAGEVLPWDE